MGVSDGAATGCVFIGDPTGYLPRLEGVEVSALVIRVLWARVWNPPYLPQSEWVDRSIQTIPSVGGRDIKNARFVCLDVLF